MREIKNFENNNYYQIVTIDELKTKLKELDFDTIEITDGEIIKRSEGVFKIIENDKSNPFVVKDCIFNKTLIINPDYYINNQKEVEDIIKYIAMFNPKRKLDIRNKALVDDRLITSLCHNANLEEVALGRFEDIPYSLTNEHYLQFKNSKIQKVITKAVDDELKENFDDIISFNSDRSLIGYYKHREIIGASPIIVSDILDDTALQNLRYLTDDNDLIFYEKSYDNIGSVINRLQELNLNCKITINISDNKKKLNEMLFNGQIPQYNNLHINMNGTILSIEQYKKFEQILYDMIEPAKELSPFERYIYAYNVTKKYKKYKENPDDKNMSRNLYEILQNEYMVCVGFSRMLGDLLDKLNIKSMDYGVSVDTSYDTVIDKSAVPVAEEVVATRAGHARRMVYIKDEKYGINGFYVTDPTWDNDMEQDLYTHMVMTHEEINSSERYNFFNIYGAYELMNAKTIEEFYELANFLLSRVEKKSVSFDKDKRITLMKDLINIIKLDESFMKKLIEKYPNIDNYKWENVNVNEVAYDLANYIVSHANQKVSGETIMSGVRNVYESAYGYTGEELKQKMSEIIKQNYERSMIKFPKLFKIDENDNKTVVMNEENKFETEEIKKSR